jgi:TonB family protein
VVAPCVAAFTLHLSAQTSDTTRICAEAATVPFDEAARSAVDKVQPEIPPLAKQMRIQGTVRIEVCISEAGVVILTKPVNGDPILIPAAVEAAKKWRFKPRMNNSVPVPFRTVLEILFSQGSTPKDFEEESKVEDQYFQAQDHCRSSLQANKLDEAAKRCQESIDLAQKLPKERANERRLAHSFTGQAYFGERKFDRALELYQRELDIAVSSLGPDEAELAYAHHHVALALHALGNAKEAQKHYEQAEVTLQLARDHIGLEELKPKYSKTLENIRSNYLILLKQTGQTALAAEVEKRLKAGQ